MYKGQDYYFKKAKEEGYLARSAYKLKEIQRKYRIIRPSDTVLELGAAPGAWSQVILEILYSGHLVSLDIQPIRWRHKRASFLVRDVFEEDLALPKGPFDCIVSDMASPTSGVRVRDQALSLELCQRAFVLAEKLLKPQGNFLIKVFEGPDMDILVRSMKRQFRHMERIRPKSTRQVSKEIYLLGSSKLMEKT